MTANGWKFAGAAALVFAGFVAADMLNGAPLGFWARLVLGTTSSWAGALLWDRFRE